MNYGEITESSSQREAPVKGSSAWSIGKYKNKTKKRKFLCPKSLIPKIFLKFDTSSTLSFSAESNDGL